MATSQARVQNRRQPLRRSHSVASGKGKNSQTRSNNVPNAPPPIQIFLTVNPTKYTAQGPEYPRNKQHSSLDCYQNFANGWVREVYCMIFGENRLLIAKVREAMSLTVVLLSWHRSLISIVSFSRLIVLRGCPKSLSLLGSSAKNREKSCRPTVIAWLVLAKVVPMHVASLLWAIEAGFKRRDSLTVTEKKAYWVLPSAVKSVPYSRMKDIQFSKTLTSKPSPAVKDKSVPTPLETELTNFLSSIKNCVLKTCTVISYTWTLWLLCTQISGSWTTNCAVKFVW